MIKVYKVLQIGEYHLDHCEDYLSVEDIGQDMLLCAVMDGCTMGQDSYFVSTLVGKLLRKICKEIAYRDFYNIQKVGEISSLLKEILKSLFQELRLAKNQLALSPNELLTTLVILIADKRNGTGVILVVGDGVVCVNGKTFEFDHDNKPDYLGYHLSSDFDQWFNAQTQIIEIDQIHDVSIATDGILMFSKVTAANDDRNINPLDFLLIDRFQFEDEQMLSKRVKVLEHQFGLKPTDDLAVVRVVAKDFS
ncbi:MAG: hypothetical protein EOO88_44300 [Pedobacter sp.]|nr:MAG: hypothetical protein EOO88_44300 [Pedobacter sp.]